MADIRYRIVLIGDEGLWAELPPKGTLVVGSSGDRAGFVISGQGVEGAHCAIGRVKGGGFAIKDLGTRAGTLINGKKISSARLSPGDEINVGARRLTIADPSEPAPIAKLEPEREAPVAGQQASLEATPLTRDEAAHRRPPKDTPERIAGYRIEKLLGRGGMGMVYLALQENLNRPVALKVLSPKRAADAEFVRRFQAEARAAAALHHPNVVIVHDVGEAGGYHYLSMEYMAAGSLEDRVAGHGALPWRKVLDVLHDAACGLVYAEERGIVHRDIKPANLMIGASGATKIADLGLATGAESEDSADGGKVFGTPHFISPEQARGEAVDGRSDLYSLGATAYRLITGRTPFQGETARDIVRAHFTVEPDPIEDAPDAVNALVQRLLKKDANQRFATAKELLQAIDKLRVAADHGTPAEPAKESSSGKLIGIGVFVVVLALLGFLALKSTGDDGNGQKPRNDTTAALPANGIAADDPVLTRSGDFFDEGTDAAPAVDEEQELRVLELEAKLALSELSPALSPEARIQALEALAARFATTTIASVTRAEVDELRAEIRRAEAAERRRELALAGIGEKLRFAAAWPPEEGQAPHAARSLAALFDFELPTELKDAPVLASLQKDLAAEITAVSKSHFAALLTRAEAHMQAGEFDDAALVLNTFAEPLAVPELDPEPAGYADLAQLARRATDHLSELTVLRGSWQATRLRADYQKLAAAFGPHSDGGELLAQRDFAGLRARFGKLGGELVTDGARLSVTRTAREVPFVLLAREAVIEGFARGEWARKPVIDSTGRRSTNREAVGVSSEGITVDRNGSAELRPWKVFGPRELYHLYSKRLDRKYTAEEQRGILAALTFAAIDNVHDLASRELSRTRRSVFGTETAQRVVTGFGPARDWLAANEGIASESVAFLAAEEAAAALIAKALLAKEEGRWAQAVSSLEALFDKHSSSFLVTLLSDGETWLEPDVAAALPVDEGN